MPAGLSLNSGTGLVSGSPTASLGASTLVFNVTDNNGATAQGSVTITTNLIGFTNLNGGVVSALSTTAIKNATFTFSTNVEGGQPSYAYSITSGTLPAGLTLLRATVRSAARRQRPGSTVTITATDQNHSYAEYRRAEPHHHG